MAGGWLGGGRGGVCRVLQLQEELASFHFGPLGERREEATVREARWQGPDPDLHLRASEGRKEPHLQGRVGGFGGLFTAIVDEGTGLVREAPDGVDGSKPAPKKVGVTAPESAREEPLASTGCLLVFRRGGGTHKQPPTPEQADLRLKIAKQNLLGDPGCQVSHPDSEPLPAREHVGHPQEQETPASLC